MSEQTAVPTPTTRDGLRAKILGQQVKRVVVNLDGMDIEIRQMNVGQLLDTVGVEDRRRQMALYLINCCFVPGTEDRIFEEADMDVLMGMPAGGYYSKLMEEVQKQMVPAELKKAEKS